MEWISAAGLLAERIHPLIIFSLSLIILSAVIYRYRPRHDAAIAALASSIKVLQTENKRLAERNADLSNEIARMRSEWEAAQIRLAELSESIKRLDNDRLDLVRGVAILAAQLRDAGLRPRYSPPAVDI